MFSYFQGIRPGTRRAVPSQVPFSYQSESGKETHEGSVQRAQRYFGSTSKGALAADTSRTRPSSSGAPTLPPIPRIASQYDSSEDLAIQSPDLVVQSRNGENDSRHMPSRSSDSSVTAQPTTEGVNRSPPQPIPDTAFPLQRTGLASHRQQVETKAGESHHTRVDLARSYTAPVTTKSLSGRVSEIGNTRTQTQLPANAVVTQARNGKPRLNLLNPMSLLARRRSAQADNQVNNNSSTAARSSSTSVSRLPDNYDPRIRGKVVHDFSAPRPKHYSNAPDMGRVERRASPRVGPQNAGSDDGAKQQVIGAALQSGASSQAPGGDNVQISERQHTPVFKEQFDDEMESWRFDSNDRRNKHTTGLLGRIVDEEIQDQHPSLPLFARNFPSDIAKNMHMEDASFLVPKKTPPPPIPELFRSVSPQVNTTTNVGPITTPPNTRSRASSITDPTFQSGGLPKHLRSNASRFSFDFAGVGSAAQEKLLEERHRQKNATGKRGSATSRASATASSAERFDEDGLFLEDGLNYDDGLEERIPGVNADPDDEFVDNGLDYGTSLEEGIPGVNVDSDDAPGDNFNHQVPQSINFSLPRGTSRASQRSEEVSLQHPTEDLHVQSLAYKISHASSDLARRYVNQPVPQDTIGLEDTFNISTSSIGVTLSDYPVQVSADQMASRSRNKVYEDDLYFDDGLIDQLDDWEGDAFDESAFDDEASRVYGLPLRDLKPLPNIVESSSAETSQQSTRPISTESGCKPDDANPETDLDLDRQSMPPPETIPMRKNSLARPVLSGVNFDQSAGLTQDNLAAYHTALVLATNRAARDGRFDRKPSADASDRGQNLGEEQRLRVSFNEGQLGRELDIPHPISTEDDTRTFNMEDEQDDDAIIAAANAEALENDDEGFYGREFGFFAHANGSGEAQYSNGGFFGPAGSDGLKRSHSGKANFQEPSLTPITERSEWSQRNSMISLAMQGVYSPTMPNPGLVQLADAMQYEDDNMSLSALLRLRRGAFGGSNGSLRSAGSHKSGSLQTYLPPTGGAMFTSALNGTNLAGSSYSLVSNGDFGSDADYTSTNPILTLQTQGLAMAAPSMEADKSSGSDSSPKRRNAVKGPGHSRNSSAAESVSYVKETDEDGAGRWVVEKRRTAEGGQVEILGRQIVEGGRI